MLKFDRAIITVPNILSLMLTVIIIFVCGVTVVTIARAVERTDETASLIEEYHLKYMSVKEHRWTIPDAELYDIMKIKVCNKGNRTVKVFAVTIKFYNSENMVMHRTSGYSKEKLEPNECLDIEVIAMFPDEYTEFKVMVTEVEIEE